MDWDDNDDNHDGDRVRDSSTIGKDDDDSRISDNYDDNLTEVDECIHDDNNTIPSQDDVDDGLINEYAYVDDGEYQEEEEEEQEKERVYTGNGKSIPERDAARYARSSKGNHDDEGNSQAMTGEYIVGSPKKEKAKSNSSLGTGSYPIYLSLSTTGNGEMRYGGKRLIELGLINKPRQVIPSKDMVRRATALGVKTLATDIAGMTLMDKSNPVKESVKLCRENSWIDFKNHAGDGIQKASKSLGAIDDQLLKEVADTGTSLISVNSFPATLEKMQTNKRRRWSNPRIVELIQSEMIAGKKKEIFS